MNAPESELYAEIHNLLTARIFDRLNGEQFQRLEELLASSPEARRIYVRYIQETIGLQAMLGPGAAAVVPASVDASHGPVAAPEAAKSAAMLPAAKSSSPLLGFLGRLRNRSADRLMTNALAWMVMAVLCSGVVVTMVMTIVFCIGLVLQRGGEIIGSREPARVAAAPRKTDAPAKAVGAPQKVAGAAQKNRDAVVPQKDAGAPQVADADASPLDLIADQAPRMTSSGDPAEPILVDEQLVIKARSELVPFPLFGTGAGLKRGGSDPHWEIVQMSDRKSFAPQPAVVAEPYGFYVRNVRGKGRWISDTRGLHEAAGGARWTFRTHFDLSGFSPSTARIVGFIAVDDFIAGLELNGKKLGLSKAAHSQGLYGKFSPFIVDSGFLSGDNKIEIVVENSTSRSNDPNAIALLVDWKGYAKPLPKH